MPIRTERARRSSSHLLHGLACGLLGCAAESADAPPPYASLPVLAGCEQESYEPCDPLDAACQTRVFATVQCLRGMPDAVLPPIRVLTAAQRRAEVGELFQQEPDEAARSKAEESVLVLLGLAQSGELSAENMAQVFVDTTAAYYSSETGLVTLFEHERHERRDPDQDTLTLSHEFVHALQDQDVGLDSVQEGASGFDDNLGRDCLIEGEAEMTETFVSAAYWGFGENPDFRRHFSSWVGNAEKEFQDVSPLLAAPRYVPYSYGARYVYDLFEQGGTQSVRERFHDPPHSALPILLSVDQVTEPVLESFDALAVPSSLAGFDLVLGDTLGPWVFEKFLERALVGPVPPELMPSWRGDRLLVYAVPGTSQAAGLWTLRLTEANAAERLRGLLDGDLRTALRENAFISRRDRDVTIGVSSNPLALPDWSAALDVAQQSWGEPASAELKRQPPHAGLAELLRRRLRR